MKVMLVNGSPHKNGTTSRALDEVQRALQDDGVEVGRFWVGNKPIAGCIACKYCADHDGECVFSDVVNEFNHVAQAVRRIRVRHPGALRGRERRGTASFMDRSFYSQAMGGVNFYPFKPAASVVVARRSRCASTSTS